MNYLIKHPSTVTDNGALASSGQQGEPARDFRKRFGNMSKTTFYGLVKRGDLSIRKIGRRTYIDADEAERWWRSCAKGQR